MKIQKNGWGLLLTTFVTVASVFVLVAWAGNPKTATAGNQADTIPKRDQSIREKKGRDFDKELKMLEKAESAVSDIESEDWDKIWRDIEEAIEKVDLDKIKIDAERVIQDINIEKIEKEIKDAFAKIDVEKLEKEINQALKEATIKLDKEELKHLQEELENARKEIRSELKSEEFRKDMEKLRKVDLDKIEKEIQQGLEKAREEMEKAKEEINKEKPDIKEEMEKAKSELAEARKEILGYQEMVYDMEEQGLLDTDGDYKVSFNEGDLYINDEKQSASVTSRYRKYFKKNTRIEKRNGNMRIDHDKKSTKATFEI